MWFVVKISFRMGGINVEKILAKTGLSEKELLEKAYKIAFQGEKKYWGCSQSIMLPFIELLGLNAEVLKGLTGMAGGIASTTEGPCGAYIAGILCLGYFFGRDYNSLENKQLIERPKEMILDFRNKFVEHYGSCICKEIHQNIFGRTFDLNCEEGWEEFETAGAHDDKCTGVVGKAAMWVMDILIDAAKNVPKEE